MGPENARSDHETQQEGGASCHGLWKGGREGRGCVCVCLCADKWIDRYNV